jgi:hypothetical protein
MEKDKEVLTKKCPFCGEEILAVAIKCKWCKSNLQNQNDRLNKKGLFKKNKLIITLISLCSILFLVYFVINIKPSINEKNNSNAYLSLKKIEASIDSGVRYSEYCSLVNAANFEIKKLDNNKELMQLSAIYTCYQLSKDFWSAEINKNSDEIVRVIRVTNETYNNPFPADESYYAVLAAHFAFDLQPDGKDIKDLKVKQYLWAQASLLIKHY